MHYKAEWWMRCDDMIVEVDFCLLCADINHSSYGVCPDCMNLSCSDKDLSNPRMPIIANVMNALYQYHTLRKWYNQKIDEASQYLWCNNKSKARQCLSEAMRTKREYDLAVIYLEESENINIARTTVLTISLSKLLCMATEKMTKQSIMDVVNIRASVFSKYNKLNSDKLDKVGRGNQYVYSKKDIEEIFKLNYSI